MAKSDRREVVRFCWLLTPRPSAAPRIRIYQLLPRLFSNINETRKPNGTLLENGCGKFAEINDRALESLRDELNITHIWLTGVHAHATATDYPDKPADDPDILKGVAGSPYAIKDYGDVCPDYAIDPNQRLAEFRKLIARIQAAGLRVIMDFVPNHVARSHASEIVRLGDSDDRALFFAPQNNFFWLQPDSPGGGPPLRLPLRASQSSVAAACDGLFDPERLHSRVTGNNSATWSPSIHDWFETVKLNYGYEFTTGRRAFPHAAAPTLPVPDTWQKMDRVLAYWQDFGVDGFRCDMAHMIPPEFWQWVVAKARARQPHVTFIAEAYNNDPMKVEGSDPFVAGFGSVNIELLNAGFDAVYDDPAYKALKNIYDGAGWANDLDGALRVRDERLTPDYVFHRSLRYAENHDEVRLASPRLWAGAGMNVGRPVSAILFGLSRGPVLLYSGQEVGEPAIGAEGFSGDDGRTSIFDYWSMPEFTKWVNGHAYDGGHLSPEQKNLRAFYGRLLSLVDEPAFRDGDFIPLNARNVHNPAFGRLPGETPSGHWLYAFIRHDRHSRQVYLVVANLHPSSTFADVRIELSPRAAAAIKPQLGVTLSDHLSDLERAIIVGTETVLLPNLPPLNAGYFALGQVKAEPAQRTS
jgi:glycosidase